MMYVKPERNSAKPRARCVTRNRKQTITKEGKSYVTQASYL